MAKATRTITPSKSTIRFANGTTVDAGPYSGEVTQWSGKGRGLRSVMLPADRDLSVGFESALAEAGFVVEETIHVDARGPAPLAGLRSGKGADRVVISPPKPPGNSAQVILYQDESGGMSWHFPDGHFRPGGSAGLRRSSRDVFTIPLRTAAARTALGATQPALRLRGPVTRIGRKIFKVLLVPLAGLVAAPLNKAVAATELRYRQELVRAITAENYRTRVSDPFTGWRRLAGRRSLLIVHGIFSTTEGMLSQLPPKAMEQLVQSYGGRVIALDQRTASRSPEENARTFLDAVAAANVPGLSFDILCHSRGGIVARTLAERGATLVPAARCDFKKVFFVATPNAGSALADPKHLVELLDVFTNWFTNFPDGPVAYSLEIILGIVKLVAFAAGTEVPGIAAMGTAGYIAKTLNRAKQPSPAQYAAAASNYEPDPRRDNGFFTGRFADWILDRVFEKASNDLIVPTDGVAGRNGHPSFPIARPLVYATSDAVPHTGFFGRERTVERILDFFEAAPSRAAISSPPDLMAFPETEMPMVLRSREEASEDFRISRRDVTYEDEGVTYGDDLGMAGPGAGLGGDGGAGLPTRRGRIVVAERRGAGKKKGGGGSRASRGAIESRKTAAPAPRKTAAPVPRKAAAPARRKADRRPAAAEPESVQREPEIVFHEMVYAGEEHALTVRLSDVIVPGGSGTVSVPMEKEETTISVSLHAPGFVVKPSAEATMVVKRDRDPSTEEVTFQLTARNPGAKPLRREIIAEFWHGTGLIGSVTHRTYVTPKGYQGELLFDGFSKSDGFHLAPGRREDCDFVLTIARETDHPTAPFRLWLRSELPSLAYGNLNCGNLHLPQRDLSKYINSALDEILEDYPLVEGLSNSATRAAIAKWNRRFLTRLRDLGKQLWTFLPEKFRNLYFEARSGPDAIRSILIHSDEMVFPWELVIPNGTVGNAFVELEPLGVSHVLGRWQPGSRLRPSPNQRMSAKAFVLVRPTYSGRNELPWAEVEERELKQLLAGVEILRPADAETFRTKLLQRKDVRIVHYSGHGEFDPKNADLNTLLLEDDTTIDVLGMANTVLGSSASPILYLNACSVGTTAITVGRPGGFASACIKGGYSGIIAPYWPVNDDSAARFSIELYKKLIAGESVGKALQELRAEHQDDPTFLAFAYFGDPWTRLDFSEVQAKKVVGRRTRKPAAGTAFARVH